MAALNAAEREVAEFFASLPDDELVHRVAEAWTPAEHLRHLCIAVGAVARGLAVPRWLLRLRFGRARAPSRTYDVIRETYRASLGLGAGATGRFVPRREDLPPAQAAERRADLLGRWGRVNWALRAALEPWSEANLDRVRMPHPILGPLTCGRCSSLHSTTTGITWRPRAPGFHDSVPHKPPDDLQAEGIWPPGPSRSGVLICRTSDQVTRICSTRTACTSRTWAATSATPRCRTAT